MTSTSWLRRAGLRAGDWGNNPDDFDPAAVERAVRLARRLIGPGRYFDLDASGFEHVPEGPVLLVGNHGGGTTALDGWGLFCAWYDHFGPRRPLYGLGHEALFATRATGAWFARSGVLRATPDAARRILAERRAALVVMPGGDADVWRPASERFRVAFDGRKGYARTAILHGAPIVPVAHAGAHHTLVVLSSGRTLARRMGVRRIARAEVFPVHLSLPWGLALGPWPHLPPPTLLQYRFGEPITPPPCGPAGPRPEDIDALDAAVRASLQAMLDELAHTRPGWIAHLQRTWQPRVRRALRRARAALR
jgi:1-acyl-sn-glycerol-3-phosphate acyltransferase